VARGSPNLDPLCLLEILKIFLGATSWRGNRGPLGPGIGKVAGPQKPEDHKGRRGGV
jgi:hypothetical protein